MIHIGIFVIIIVFNILGLWGNVNILWTNCRKRELRSKHGCLLAIQSVYHLVCLLSELVNAAYSFQRTSPSRNVCLMFLAPYLFVICSQAAMYEVISIDLLMAVLRPLSHRMLRPLPYLLIVSIPVWIFSLVFTVWGWLAVDDSPILFCNPPLVLAPPVSSVWVGCNLVIGVSVIVIHGVICKALHKGDEQRTLRKNVISDERKVFRSLSVQLFVFVFSWFTGILGVYLASRLLPKEQNDIVQSYMVFFALLCYSQSYYVLLLRSPEYRRSFLEQFRLLFFLSVESEPLLGSKISRLDCDTKSDLSRQPSNV